MTIASGTTLHGTVTARGDHAFTVADTLWPSWPPRGARVEVTVTYISPYQSLVEDDDDG